MATEIRRRDIEHEIPAFLVENGETVKAKRVSKQFDRSVRLLDDAQQSARVGNGYGTTFCAAAQFLHQQFDLLAQFFGRRDGFRDGVVSEICKDNPGIAAAI